MNRFYVLRLLSGTFVFLGAAIVYFTASIWWYGVIAACCVGIANVLGYAEGSAKR